MKSVRTAAGMVVRFVSQIFEHDVPGLAAELSYRFMFATFPFVIFVAALAGFMAGWLGIADPTTRIINTIGKELPADLIEPVRRQLHSVLARTDPQLLSAGALLSLYVAVGGMNALMKAMNRASGWPEKRSLPHRIAVAALLTIVGGAAIVLSFVIVVGGTLATRRLIDEMGLGAIWPTLALLRWPVAFVLLVTAVAALLRYAPSVRTPWHLAAVSATVFAIVWLTVTYAFGLYVARFATYDATYGALAGVIVLMFWFYLSSFLLVCSAELAALLIRLRAPELLPPSIENR